MLKKATTLDVDCVCMDLEDAVAPAEKAAARAAVVETLATQTFQPRTERLVRINAVGTGLEADDVAALVAAPVLPDGVGG
jgi:citrate lyase beta subunit